MLLENRELINIEIQAVFSSKYLLSGTELQPGTLQRTTLTVWRGVSSWEEAYYAGWNKNLVKSLSMETAWLVLKSNLRDILLFL